MIVYPDTCIVIYLIERREPWAARIGARLLPPGPVPRLAFSDLTRLECRVGPMREQRTELLREFDDFFSTYGFLRVSLDTAAFDLATQLRAAHGLKTPDALHLAAAINAGCDEFWTNDDLLAKAAGSRIAIVTF